MDPASTLTISGAIGVCDPATVDPDLGGADPDVIVADCDGTWTIDTVITDLGRSGPRASRLVADRVGAEVAGEAVNVGFVSVDSGHAMICGLSDARAGRIDAEAVAEAMDAAGPSAARVPGVEAVCCLSGMGDGSYDVLVSDETGSGRPARI